MYDELDLDMLGDERTALFLIMSDTDGTFAFLISLIYSILFNRLCERACNNKGCLSACFKFFDICLHTCTEHQNDHTNLRYRLQK